MNGKISQLPHTIQEQLNQRLEAGGEEAKSILAWLNALPEVKAILKDKFDGAEITPKNLSEHKSRGFRDWEARQQALEFADHLKADDSALQSILPNDVPEKLSRWLTVRYAAATRAVSPGHEDVEKELRHLRQLCVLLLGLRRGELSAGRLALEQQRLAMVLSETKEAKEKEFWEWTKRPDIYAKLHPDLDPDAVRRKVVEMLDRELLGSPSREAEETAEPAILI